MGDDPLDDELRRLAAAAHAGDQSARDSGIAHFKQLATPVVRRYLQNEEDREDAIQELLVDLNKLIGQILRKPQLSPRAIVRRVAMNKSIDIVRRKGRHPVVQFGRMDPNDIASSRHVEPDIEFIDLTARIRERLAPREMTVFVLLWQGHKPGEIAKMLELHPGRISHMVAAIREKIRDIWPGDGAESGGRRHG